MKPSELIGVVPSNFTTVRVFDRTEMVEIKAFNNLRDVAPEHEFKIIHFPSGEDLVRFFFKSPPPAGTRINITLTDASFRAVGIFMQLIDIITTTYPRVTVLGHLPYLPNGRQDRVATVGDCEVCLLFLKCMALLDVYMHTDDMHNTKYISNYPKPFKLINRNRLYEMIQKDIQDKILDPKETVLIYPDKGSVERYGHYVRAFGFAGFRVGSKVRDPVNGHISSIELVEDPTQILVTPRKLLVIDDLCDGGRTFVMLAEALKMAYPDLPRKLYLTTALFFHGVSNVCRHYDQVKAHNFFINSINS